MTTATDSDLALKLATPHSEGEFETGCQTFNGNDLVLFYETTRELSEALPMYFERVAKYMKSKRFSYYDKGKSFYNLWRSIKWDAATVTFSGYGILNDAFDIVASRLAPFLERVIAQYLREIGEIEWENERGDVCKDVLNYLFRRYEEWLPEYIRGTITDQNHLADIESDMRKAVKDRGVEFTFVKVYEKGKKALLPLLSARKSNIERLRDAWQDRSVKTVELYLF